jgi:hypothetical protein
MRIATWNVNSLKARLEKVTWWLGRARPDVLLMQETKLADGDVPVEAFEAAGYEVAHHGEGRWNGVAIAARDGLSIGDVVTNFGDGPVRDSGPGAPAAADMDPEDFDPFDEARMLAATVDGVRLVSLYAPNGRVVDSPSTPASWPGSSGWVAGSVTSWRRMRAVPTARCSSAATSTWPRPTPTSGTPTPPMAGRTSPSPSGPRSGRCSTPG